MSARRAHSQAGITLMEILIILGVIGLIMVLLPSQVSFLRKGSLRTDAAKLAAAMRWAYDRAAATSVHHRMVLDLDEGGFLVERCEGKVRLVRSIDEAHAQEAQAILAQAALLPELEQARAAAEAGTSGATPVGPMGLPPPMGGASAGDLGASGAAMQCTPVKGKHGQPQKLGKGFGKVYVAHLTDPADEGKVTINFFPNGRGERAVVEVTDKDDHTFSVRLHPLSGHVDIKSGEYRKPADIVAGSDVPQ